MEGSVADLSKYRFGNALEDLEAAWRVMKIKPDAGISGSVSLSTL